MIIVQTPLRISFLGGGTDFEDYYLHHGGAILSTAIDKHIFVIVKERFDDLICINYTKRESVEKVDDVKHELVREALRLTGIDKGIEITTLADIPAEGTGLGSSSSITAGLLQALYAYKGERKTAGALAKEACQIEIDILGKPIGKQDQYIAAYGNLRFISFNESDISVENVMLSQEGKRKLNDSLLLVYTGITRNSSDVLEEQRDNIHRNVDVLSEMKTLSFKAKEALVDNAFDEFGEILHQGWELKRTLASKITNSEIDAIYEVARNAGATGGKITGAGSGGFLLLYCPQGKKDEVRRAMKSLRELPFNIDSAGSKVIFNYEEYRNSVVDITYISKVGDSSLT